jgi:hypothetical protein
VKHPLNPLELAGLVTVLIGVVWGLGFGVGIGVLFFVAGRAMRAGQR